MPVKIQSDLVLEIRPQPRQEVFLSSSADITIYGGGAGGGKTWALMVEPIRHSAIPDFGAVIFRRTIPEIIKEGAMWDESLKIYPYLGAQSNEHYRQHTFPSGARISFASLQYESSLDDWRGSQIPLICFDQLETFTSKQFFYMFSRNRSMCGVTPYIRATCNPEPGWLADFLDWWIADDGYADLSRVGKIRWMIRLGDSIVWADTAEELITKHPGALPKSVTFIVATIYDNPRLMEADPAYLANLQALDYIDQARLLGDPKRGGNWRIKPSAGTFFNREWFDIVEPHEVPVGGHTVRFWDFAATKKTSKKKDPDFTASTKMKKVGNIYYVLHMTEERLPPGEADERMLELSRSDGPGVAQRWEQEAGASGIRDSHHIAVNLDGFDAQGRRPVGKKLVRAKPFAAQAYAGNVKLVRGVWNNHYLDHLHGQPDWPHDDVMDSSSGCYQELSKPQKRGRSYQG